MDITIKLPDTRWNEVLDMLSDQPVKRAMPIINEIVSQARLQLGQQATQAANGAAALNLGQKDES